MELEYDSRVVRCLREFEGSQEGELSLGAGDLVQVIRREDKYWLYGYCAGKLGSFPTLIASPVELSPQTATSAPELFASKEAFKAQESGDLSLDRGILVLGLREVDDNWWFGKRIVRQTGAGAGVGAGSEDPETEEEGIFPLTHVWKLRKDLLPSLPSYGTNGLTEEQPEGRRQGVVNTDLKSQLEHEIDLVKGARVSIYGNHDKHYYRGVVMGESNPKVGIFPKAFVTLTADPVEVSLNTDPMAQTNPVLDDPFSGLDNPPSYESALLYQSLSHAASQGVLANNSSGVTSYGRSLFPFQAEFENELSFGEGEIVHLIRYVDSDWIEGELNNRIGIFPLQFIQIVVDVHDHHELEKVEEEEMIYPRDSYARAIASFVGEVEGDLSIESGSTVTLLRRLGKDWVEAEDDSGNIGICPFNHLELIEDTANGQPVYTNNSAITGSPCVSLIDEPLDMLEETLSLPSQEENGTQPIRSPMYAPGYANTVLQHPPRPSPPPSLAGHKEPNSQTPSRAAPRPPLRRQGSSRSTTSVSPSDRQPSLQPQPQSQQPEEQQPGEDRKRQKMLEQRSCIIMELIQSERDYLRDLNVCYTAFEKPMQTVPDLKAMLGNLSEVICASQKLVMVLEETIRKKEERIGRCFLLVGEQIRVAYSFYCQCNEDVPIIWQKLIGSESSPETKKILERCLERIRKDTNCFDIPSLLIKPVQRILKYPLLLSELMKCSANEEEKKELEKAIKMMTEMATEINESKRRKDLVNKYRKVKREDSFSSRFSKLNMHTMKKKSSRLGFKISSAFGLSSQTNDEEFEVCVQKFRTLEKTLKIYIKDLKIFMEQKQEFIKSCYDVIEDLVAFYGEKSNQQEVEQLRATHRLFLENFWDDMRKQVDNNITQVLTKLLEKFESPNRLIDKRNDKLTDYDAASKRVNSEKSSDPIKLKQLKEEQSAAKNTYEALNRQLLDDLPQLTTASIKVFYNSMGAFLKIRKRFIGKTAQQMLSLLDLPLLLSSSYAGAINVADIQETFQIKYNLIADSLAADFSLVPKQVFGACPAGAGGGSGVAANASLDRSNSTRSSSSSSSSTRRSSSFIGKQSFNKQVTSTLPQSTNQREVIERMYPESIFIVTNNYDGVDIMDISVRTGDWVGVVKRQDPMGNTLRYFVDNGHNKGFIPSKILTPYFIPQQHQPSLSSCSSNTLQPLHPRNKYHAPPPPPPPRQASMKEQPQRYDQVTDVYQNLLEVETNDMMSFNETNDTNRDQVSEHRYCNLSEFDPLAPSAPAEPSNQYEEVRSEQRSEVTQSHRYEDIEEAEKEVPPEYYFAGYPFDCKGNTNQLSLKFGQVVRVKAKSDLHGNAEWWFVEDRSGEKGYVPSNYLTKNSGDS